MTHQVTVDEAQAQLPGLVEALKRVETVGIEQDNKPVVQLIAIAPTQRHARFGSAGDEIR